MSDPARKKLTYKRGIIKRRITNIFQSIEAGRTEKDVSIKLIQDYLVDVQACDAEINEFDFSEESSELDEESMVEIDAQTEYVTEIRTKIASLSNPIPDVKTETEVSDSGNFKLRLPELSCETFSGEGTTNLDFHSFISCFNNVVGFRKNLSENAPFWKNLSKF